MYVILIKKIFAIPLLKAKLKQCCLNNLSTGGVCGPESRSFQIT